MSSDKIVYTLVSNPGGVDGRDHLHKGGTIMMAAYDRATLEKSKAKPWCKIVAQVIDTEARKKSALYKLDPIDRLILGV